MTPQTHHPAVDKWVVALTVMFGTFIVVMDISVVNVALPHMMGRFSTTMSAITWVATAYAIAGIILTTLAGWLSALIGRKRLYLLSYALFTVGSILCGCSQTFTQMIIFRIIQGIGGGALIPLSQAILRESFPEEEQGMAMAVYSMGVVLAPAIGPILGGWLTDDYGWPWIFFINVPVCVVGLFFVSAYVHDPPYLRRGVARIDWIGIVLLSLILTTLQIVLERGQENNWFQSSWITTMTVLTLAAILVLIWWELRAPHPVLDIRLLKNLPLSTGSLIGLVFGLGLFGSTFILPQFTQELLGYPALESGLVLAPRAMTLLLCLPLVGWIYQYVDARLLILFGLGIVFWSMLELSHLSLHCGFWNLVPTLMLMGTGMPFVFVTLSTITLSTVERSRMTEATSIFTLCRNVGGNIGYALIATVIARQQQVHHVQLAAHVSDTNPLFVSAYQQATGALVAHGANPAQVPQLVMSLVDRMINSQARMMAYNDASLILAVLFLLTIPLVFILPSRRSRRRVAARA
ncbi:MAG: DHA2 family efflux MFS transporter permease subunit [Phycisphaeraceae bacterium]|nr:DHA2 family efflux MFS transporter permease subunit [Phycisphaeraceae bacterium]